MNKDVSVLLEDKDAIEVIRKRFNIEEVRFGYGIEFVQYILDGDSKNKAYSKAFDVEPDKARMYSSQFHRGKWIQELIKYLRPDEDSLYLSEIKKIIGAGMAIVNDTRSSPREKTEAMKALQPYIKAENQRLEIDLQVTETTGASIVSQLTDKIALLASNGKMIDETGEVIDVFEIE